MKKLLVFALTLAFVVGICGPSISIKDAIPPLDTNPEDVTKIHVDISSPKKTKTTLPVMLQNQPLSLDIYIYIGGEPVNTINVGLVEIDSQGEEVGQGQEISMAGSHAKFVIYRGKNYKIYDASPTMQQLAHTFPPYYLFNVSGDVELAFSLINLGGAPDDATKKAYLGLTKGHLKTIIQYSH